MYAIAFDLDIENLRNSYHNDSYTNAYVDIRKTLEKYGFDGLQGSVYFGNEKVNPVTCVLAVAELKKAHTWFSASVRDIRMLRIEEDNDLMPIVENDI